jgi:hypothetical protein
MKKSKLWNQMCMYIYIVESHNLILIMRDIIHSKIYDICHVFEFSIVYDLC